MKISTKALNDTKVYLNGQDEAMGVLTDILAEKNGGCVSAYVIESISLVPLQKVVERCDIESLTNNKITLKEGIEPESLKTFEKRNSRDFVRAKEVKRIVRSDFKTEKTAELCFDFETGELCDIIASKGLIGGKRKISANKIYLKDNTIYIE